MMADAIGVEYRLAKEHPKKRKRWNARFFSSQRDKATCPFSGQSVTNVLGETAASRGSCGSQQEIA